MSLSHGRGGRSSGKASAEAGGDVDQATPGPETTATEPGFEDATPAGEGIETSAPEA